MTRNQQLLLPGIDDASVPNLEVIDGPNMSDVAVANWHASGLDSFAVPCEEWTSAASNQALRYATHGLFRYFGKFPPFVARHLIPQYTEPAETVLDPMIGCGTTAVEAVLLKRNCVGIELNPLGVLLTRVKCRRVSLAKAENALKKVMSNVTRRHRSTSPENSKWPTCIRTEHFFLPETCHWLQLLRESIARISDHKVRDLLWVAFASIIRKVSRATTEQGRLFLDVETAEPDPRPRFESAARQAIELTCSLPKNGVSLETHEASCMDIDFGKWQVPLVICHPPYFNVYRYSRVFSLETAWLGHEVKPIRKKEIREFFKVGKPENVGHYVKDMHDALQRIARALTPKGTLALMVGDTVIHGKRIQTTRLVVEAVADALTPFKIAVRTPKFTEASWAASQRRTGKKVGVSLTDFIVHFRRRR
jgi:hypothetical protein